MSQSTFLCRKKESPESEEIPFFKNSFLSSAKNVFCKARSVVLRRKKRGRCPAALLCRSPNPPPPVQSLPSSSTCPKDFLHFHTTFFSENHFVSIRLRLLSLFPSAGFAAAFSSQLAASSLTVDLQASYLNFRVMVVV